MYELREYRKSSKEIYTTRDYKIFKVLIGNRDVRDERVEKTVESIQKHGWLTQPILVNEKFEVIDGQGRLEALKRLGMPVEFVIDKGIGIEECRTLNLYQKNWGTIDYINSYAKTNENYVWLKNIVQQYSKPLGMNTILSIAVSYNKGDLSAGNCTNLVKDGNVVVNPAKRKEIEERLEYITRFAEFVKIIGGRAGYFYTAIDFMHMLDIVDSERLYNAVKINIRDMLPCGTTLAYISQIEELYNKKLSKKNRVDMVHEYKMA